MKVMKIIYWSGTGNTEAMAKAVGEGVENAGGKAMVMEVSEVSAADLAMDTVLALGCPSMGAEQLEEDVMEPFFAELESQIKDKHILLFGSYGWGDEEWMRDWEGRVVAAGGCLVGETGITVLGAPDDVTINVLKDAGRKLLGIG